MSETLKFIRSRERHRPRLCIVSLKEYPCTVTGKIAELYSVTQGELHPGHVLVIRPRFWSIQPCFFSSFFPRGCEHNVILCGSRHRQ